MSRPTNRDPQRPQKPAFCNQAFYPLNPSKAARLIRQRELRPSTVRHLLFRSGSTTLDCPNDILFLTGEIVYSGEEHGLRYLLEGGHSAAGRMLSPLHSWLSTADGLSPRSGPAEAPAGAYWAATTAEVGAGVAAGVAETSSSGPAGRSHTLGILTFRLPSPGRTSCVTTWQPCAIG